MRVLLPCPTLIAGHVPPTQLRFKGFSPLLRLHYVDAVALWIIPFCHAFHLGVLKDFITWILPKTLSSEDQVGASHWEILAATSVAPSPTFAPARASQARSGGLKASAATPPAPCCHPRCRTQLAATGGRSISSSKLQQPPLLLVPLHLHVTAAYALSELLFDTSYCSPCCSFSLLLLVLRLMAPSSQGSRDGSSRAGRLASPCTPHSTGQ
jgi:hypothetical protein